LAQIAIAVTCQGRSNPIGASAAARIAWSTEALGVTTGRMLVSLVPPLLIFAVPESVPESVRRTDGRSAPAADAD